MTRIHLAVLLCLALTLLSLSACGGASSGEASTQNGIYIIPGKTPTGTVQTEPVTESPPETVMESVTEPPAVTTEAVTTEAVTTVPETEAITEAQTTSPAPETTAESAESAVTILSVTSPIAPNSNATLTAKGIPGTTYSITVYYSSGPSTAKGLADKTAASDGSLSWEWKVGQRTKAGTYRIVVYGGGETAETTFTVTE